MKKNLFSTILALICAICCMFSLAACSLFGIGGDKSGKLTFELQSDDTYAVIACEDDATGQIVIPDSFKNKPVTRIDNFVFYLRTELTDVTLPDSLTSIGSMAFSECTGLTSIKIPSKVTAVGSWAFSSCTALANIAIPDSVTDIGSDAFGDTPWFEGQPDGLLYINKLVYKYKGIMPSNTSITLEAGTKGIVGEAFQSCVELKEITIPDSVTSIGAGAFRWCRSLKEINLPESVTYIGSSAFEGTGWYENQPDGVVYINNFAYKYKGTASSSTAITIRSGTKYIVDGAFASSGIGSVKIPSSVETIGRDAFSKCKELSSVFMDPGVLNAKDPSVYKLKSIGNLAFYECKKLNSVDIPVTVTSIGTEAFRDCEALTFINFGGTKAQWDAIKKGSRWNLQSGNYKIWLPNGTSLEK